MIIHKLNVNSGRPTMDKKRRQRVRLELYNLKKFAVQCRRSGVLYRQQYNSLVGKVRELEKFHSVQGEKYSDDLKRIKPI